MYTPLPNSETDVPTSKSDNENGALANVKYVKAQEQVKYKGGSGESDKNGKEGYFLSLSSTIVSSLENFFYW